jgi:hypothetical protein
MSRSMTISLLIRICELFPVLEVVLARIEWTEVGNMGRPPEFRLGRRRCGPESRQPDYVK